MRMRELCGLIEERAGRRCTPAMVKNYESLGLIPKPPRTGGGVRVFSEDYVERISSILEMKSRYLRLDAIKEALQREEVSYGAKKGAPTYPPSKGGEAGYEDRYYRIVDAALKSFSSDGYYNTKISDVARMTGCGVGTIYRYFPNKKALLLAVSDRVIEMMLREVDQVDDLSPNPIERLKYRGLVFLKTYGHIKDIIFLMQAEAVGRDVEFSRKADELFEKFTEVTRDDIGNAISMGLIRELDVEAASYGLLGMVQMMGYMLCPYDRYTPEEIIEMVADILLRGVLV